VRATWKIDQRSDPAPTTLITRLYLVVNNCASETPATNIALSYLAIPAGQYGVTNYVFPLTDQSGTPVSLTTNDLTEKFMIGYVGVGTNGAGTLGPATYMGRDFTYTLPAWYNGTWLKQHTNLTTWLYTAGSNYVFSFEIGNIVTNSATTNFYLLSGHESAAVGSITNEVVAARGTHPNLLTRLSASTDSHALPLVESYQTHLLNDWSRACGSILYGTTTQAVVALVGDSWTSGRQRYAAGLRKRLASLYGDAGGGFVSFGTDGSGLQGWTDASDGSVTVSGMSSVTGTSGYGPALTHVVGTDQGDSVTVTVSKTGYTNVTLHWYGAADAGSVSYSYDSYATSNTIDLASATGYQTTTLIPAPSSTHTLKIELFDVGVSGCALMGVDYRKGPTATGSIVHKLGYSGGTVAHFVGNASWTNGLTALNPHLVTIMLGINDRSALDPDQFASAISSLVGIIRVPLPMVPILYIAPFEVYGTGDPTYPIGDYALAVKGQSVSDAIAWMDLGYSFGTSTNAIGARGLYLDAAHPTAEAGYLIQDRIMRALTR